MISAFFNETLSIDKSFSVSDRRMTGWSTCEVMPIMETEVCFSLAQHHLAGQGLPIIQDTPSHSDTLHLVGFLWTSDQPDPGISTRQHTPITTDRFPCPGGFDSAIPSCEQPQTNVLDRAVAGISWKRKYSEENLSHWHFVHHSFHTDSHGNEPVSPR